MSSSHIQKRRSKGLGPGALAFILLYSGILTKIWLIYHLPLSFFFFFIFRSVALSLSIHFQCWPAVEAVAGVGAAICVFKGGH